MVSELAIEMIEALEAEGLHPTARDVVRLNALGLKFEERKDARQLGSIYYLPRIAQISQSVIFRQPTIGHQIWFDRVARLISADDFNTVLAIKAFALSRPAKDLPDGDDPQAVKAAVEAYTATMRDFTQDQIYAALLYVLNGKDERDGEYPPAKPGEEDGTRPNDWNLCVALGALHEGQSVLWGLTAAEMYEMTPRQLRETLDRAYAIHHINIDSDAGRLEGEFYATLDEIRARLMKEKEAK